MGSVKHSVRVENSRGVFSSVLHSNGRNGALAVAPLVSNGYANHLYETLAMFKREDFGAQSFVQFKCESISKKVLCLIITYALFWLFF